MPVCGRLFGGSPRCREDRSPTPSSQGSSPITRPRATWIACFGERPRTSRRDSDCSEAHGPRGAGHPAVLSELVTSPASTRSGPPSLHDQPGSSPTCAQQLVAMSSSLSISSPSSRSCCRTGWCSPRHSMTSVTDCTIRDPCGSAGPFEDRLPSRSRPRPESLGRNSARVSSRCGETCCLPTEACATTSLLTDLRWLHA